MGLRVLERHQQKVTLQTVLRLYEKFVCHLFKSTAVYLLPRSWMWHMSYLALERLTRRCHSSCGLTCNVVMLESSK